MPTPPHPPPAIFGGLNTPRLEAASVSLGALYISPDGEVFVSDGESWERVVSLDPPETQSLAEASELQPEVCVPRAEVGSLSKMAELVATSLRTFVPNVEVTVEGSCITVTSPPAQTLIVSVTESSTEPPLIKVDVTPREAGEAWGDYAARIEASPPGADRETWVARLRALAGE